jgi:hypothetical protein
MKKTLLSLAVLTSFAAHADEGMWMPQQLPQVAKQLQAAGLDPASLTKLTEFPMGAVVSLGGCSASFDAELKAQLDKLYAGSKLADKAERTAWMTKSPDEFKASNDSFIKAAVAMYEPGMKEEPPTRSCPARSSKPTPTT